MSDDEEKKDDDGFSVTSQQAVKFLNHLDKDDEDAIIRNKNLYKSFIVIVFSSFCLTISLGVNEIGYYIVYIFTLIIITLSLVYFLNVEVS
jgi:hypothetical protein